MFIMLPFMDLLVGEYDVGSLGKMWISEMKNADVNLNFKGETY